MRFKLVVGIILSVMLCAGMSEAKPVTLQYDADSYQQAQHSDSYLRFDMESNKVGGLIRSDFTGFVRHFKVKGEFADNTVHDGVVSFLVNDMDTGNDKRNDQMTHRVLDAMHFPEMRVLLIHDIKAGEQQFPGFIKVMGQSHPIHVDMTVVEQGDQVLVRGKSKLSLTSLGIEKPRLVANGVATVDDKVAISYQILIPKALLYKPAISEER